MTPESNTRPNTRQEAVKVGTPDMLRPKIMDNKAMHAREGFLPSLQQLLRTPKARLVSGRTIKGKREPFS